MPSISLSCIVLICNVAQCVNTLLLTHRQSVINFFFVRLFSHSLIHANDCRNIKSRSNFLLSSSILGGIVSQYILLHVILNSRLINDMISVVHYKYLLLWKFTPIKEVDGNSGNMTEIDTKQKSVFVFHSL